MDLRPGDPEPEICLTCGWRDGQHAATLHYLAARDRGRRALGLDSNPPPEPPPAS